jgi:hypothetical protein
MLRSVSEFEEQPERELMPVMVYQNNKQRTFPGCDGNGELLKIVPRINVASRIIETLYESVDLPADGASIAE